MPISVSLSPALLSFCSPSVTELRSCPHPHLARGLTFESMFQCPINKDAFQAVHIRTLPIPLDLPAHLGPQLVLAASKAVRALCLVYSSRLRCTASAINHLSLSAKAEVTLWWVLREYLENRGRVHLVPASTQLLRLVRSSTAGVQRC